MPKLNLTEEQIEMLRKGYRRAQELPKGFNMEVWAQPDESAPCGTACCYAGELLLANKVATPSQLIHLDVPQEAANLLGVRRADLFEIFRVGWWPKDLAARYGKTRRSKARANILAEVVERFIAADGDTSDWQTSSAY